MCILENDLPVYGEKGEKMDRLLLEAVIQGRHFMFYGRVERTEHKGFTSSCVYPWVDFHDLSIREIKGKKQVKYSLDQKTWRGDALTEEDAVYEVIFMAECNAAGVADIIFMDACIKDVITYYQKEYVEYDSRRIPLKLCRGEFADLYGLRLLTEHYIFYGCEDMLLMLRTENGELVSDNYFAEIGYCEELKDIREGKVRALYTDPGTDRIL